MLSLEVWEEGVLGPDWETRTPGQDRSSGGHSLERRSNGLWTFQANRRPETEPHTLPQEGLGRGSQGNRQSQTLWEHIVNTGAAVARHCQRESRRKEGHRRRKERRGRGEDGKVGEERRGEGKSGEEKGKGETEISHTSTLRK